MIDVLLAHSYFLALDAKQTEKMRPYPPLATLYAAAVLRRAGYSVALFDAMLASDVGEFQPMLDKLRPRFVAIYEDSFNFLSKMCLLRMREAALEMASMALTSGATVIAAGPDVTDRHDLYFDHGVQFALIGEADNSLLELITALSDSHPGEEQCTHDDTHQDYTTRLCTVRGLAWPRFATNENENLSQILNHHANHNGIARTAPREPERQLDTLPEPAWDLVDIERYRSAWNEAHGYFSLNMVTTRGCPFHCNWCAKPIWGQRYAIRSPKNVVNEMRALKRAFSPDHLWFADDIFGLRGQWIAEFAREISEQDARIPFTIQSRVDLMTERTVLALAEAGCVEVWLGAESGSQKILDAMEKGTQVGQIRAARARLRDAGIRACFFVQFGYPGETLEDILATVEMVRDTLPDDIGVSVSYPLPGTRFHDMVHDEIGSKTNWDSSGDLAMMFEGTFASAFYRKLHRLLHDDLRAHHAIESLPLSTDHRRTLARLSAAWSKLAQNADHHRCQSPTEIRGHGMQTVPDLSGDWN